MIILLRQNNNVIEHGALSYFCLFFFVSKLYLSPATHVCGFCTFPEKLYRGLLSNLVDIFSVILPDLIKFWLRSDEILLSPNLWIVEQFTRFCRQIADWIEDKVWWANWWRVSPGLINFWQPPTEFPSFPYLWLVELKIWWPNSPEVSYGVFASQCLKASDGFSSIRPICRYTADLFSSNWGWVGVGVWGVNPLLNHLFMFQVAFWWWQGVMTYNLWLMSKACPMMMMMMMMTMMMTVTVNH